MDWNNLSHFFIWLIGRDFPIVCTSRVTFIIYEEDYSLSNELRKIKPYENGKKLKKKNALHV